MRLGKIIKERDTLGGCESKAERQKDVKRDRDEIERELRLGE